MPKRSQNTFISPALGKEGRRQPYRACLPRMPLTSRAGYRTKRTFNLQNRLLPILLLIYIFNNLFFTTFLAPVLRLFFLLQFPPLFF